MWKSYDWRGTVVQLPPFWLVPGLQDYGTPTYVIPDDYFGLREVYLVLITTAINLPIRKKLDIVENLERTHLEDLPQCICYRPSIAGFRIHPGPTLSMAAPNYLIDGTYKKRPPRWTSANYASQLLWDDIYFDSFVSACVWAAFKLSGQRQASMEQYAIYQQDLMRARETENLELGERVLHPTEPLSLNQGGIWLAPW